MSSGDGLRTIGLIVAAMSLVVAMSVSSTATSVDYYRTLYGDGNWHSIGNGWEYAYKTAFDMGYWRYGGNERHAFSYGSQQWYHRNNSSGWHSLGNAATCTDWIGDTAYHYLGGYYYQWLSADMGYWSTASTSAGNRYAYSYRYSQWHLRGTGTAWNTLGVAGVLPTFMGDAKYHTLGNGYYYLGLSTTGYWSTNSDKSGSGVRYKYLFGSGQWYLRGYGGTYNLLGNAGLSSSFMGDGRYHTVGNGYYYLGLSTTGYWSTNGETSGAGVRYKYLFGSGQWYLRGYDGSYNVLGNAGLSSSFMGDQKSHDLGNGYYYVGYTHEGFWNTTNALGGSQRYSYTFVNGGWALAGAGMWASLSSVGRSSRFMGDGEYHELGNGYYYAGFSTVGYWSTDGAPSGERYRYFFSTGRWYVRGYGGSYNLLGNAGLSPRFMGDGEYHELGNGYYYQGILTGAYWSTNGERSGDRYRYSFSIGQWYLYGYGSLSDVLGKAGLSSSFMGDSKYHDLGNGFFYAGFLTTGYWSTNGATSGSGIRYKYLFSTGHWYLRGYGGSYNLLGKAGLSSSFMGDGEYHALGNRYYYQGLSSNAHWSTSGTLSGDRYLYYFSSGQWYLRGYGGSYNVLGNAGLSSSFMGDQEFHALGNGYYYEGYYDHAFWSMNRATASTRYHYVFNTGQWYLSGYGGWSNKLGSGGRSSSFMGDGNYHYLGSYGSRAWYYRGQTDAGWWSVNGTAAGDRYKYIFATGSWQHSGPASASGFYALGGVGLSSAFLADGNYHKLGPNYYYRSLGEDGYWSVDGTASGDRYWYDYLTGTWYYRASSVATWHSISNSSTNTAFRNPY